MAYDTPYEQKDNTFSLFKNDKQGNDNAPDYKGNGMRDGKPVQVACWLKVSKSGITYMSGQFSEQFKKQDAAPQTATPAIDEADVPF